MPPNGERHERPHPDFEPRIIAHKIKRDVEISRVQKNFCTEKVCDHVISDTVLVQEVPDQFQVSFFMGVVFCAFSSMVRVLQMSTVVDQKLGNVEVPHQRRDDQWGVTIMVSLQDVGTVSAQKVA